MFDETFAMKDRVVSRDELSYNLGGKCTKYENINEKNVISLTRLRGYQGETMLFALDLELEC